MERTDVRCYQIKFHNQLFLDKPFHQTQSQKHEKGQAAKQADHLLLNRLTHREQNRTSLANRVRVVAGILVALVLTVVCLHDLVEFRAAHGGALWPPKQLFGVFA
jgi:hypothetical protein